MSWLRDTWIAADKQYEGILKSFWVVLWAVIITTRYMDKCFEMLLPALFF